MLVKRRGMGQSVADPSGTFPSWCNWMPFADYFASCQPATQAQINAQVQADITKAAGEDTALATQQYQAYLSDVDALCQSDPTNCAAYQAATSSPTCAAVFGTGTMASLFCGTPGQTNWFLWGGLAGLALVGVFGIVALSGGSARRYGR